MSSISASHATAPASTAALLPPGPRRGRRRQLRQRPMQDRRPAPRGNQPRRRTAQGGRSRADPPRARRPHVTVPPRALRRGVRLARDRARHRRGPGRHRSRRQAAPTPPLPEVPDPRRPEPPHPPGQRGSGPGPGTPHADPRPRVPGELTRRRPPVAAPQDVRSRTPCSPGPCSRLGVGARRKHRVPSGARERGRCRPRGAVPGTGTTAGWGACAFPLHPRRQDVSGSWPFRCHTGQHGPALGARPVTAGAARALARGRPIDHRPASRSAASTTLTISMALVIGPTPPGFGDT